MLDNVTDLAAFIAAVETSSFVAAGRKRGLTRSSIGKSVARLEERLGVRLFHRTTRALSVTAEGAALYDRSVQILSDLEALDAVVRPDGGDPKGELRITMPSAFGLSHVMPVLTEYSRQWPKLTIDASLTDRVTDLVNEGFDLGIRVGDAARESRLITRTLARAHGVVCASPSYLEGRPTLTTLEDLADHDCICFTASGQRLPWRFEDRDGPCIAPVRPRLTVDNGQAMLEATRAGLGVAQLPRFLADPALREGALLPVLVAFAMPTVPIAAIYPSRRHVPGKVRRLIDLLVQRWGEDPSITF